jgi:hypothetical protein
VLVAAINQPAGTGEVEQGEVTRCQDRLSVALGEHRSAANRDFELEQLRVRTRMSLAVRDAFRAAR